MVRLEGDGGDWVQIANVKGCRVFQRVVFLRRSIGGSLTFILLEDRSVKSDGGEGAGGSHLALFKVAGRGVQILDSGDSRSHGEREPVPVEGVREACCCCCWWKRRDLCKPGGSGKGAWHAQE